MKAPDPFLEQSTEIRSKGHLGDDLCHYEDEDGVHYFIRVTLEIPIHGIEDGFLWGVWVSLSKKSYDDYIETYNQSEIDSVYFGWLCNYLPYYKKTYALACDVYPQSHKQRPYIILHEVDNDLYDDFKNGISIEKAQEIAEFCMHG
ncbi:hypothetical protein SOHN41_00697 [Shewanella sp. HN-41]|nr:hypothetical protein SOHN41_00697 [Shewanella sp. HN-41]